MSAISPGRGGTYFTGSFAPKGSAFGYLRLPQRFLRIRKRLAARLPFAAPPQELRMSLAAKVFNYAAANFLHNRGSSALEGAPSCP